MADLPKSARAIKNLELRLDLAERRRDAMICEDELCGPNWADGLSDDEIATVHAEQDDIRIAYRAAYTAYAGAVYARVDYLKSKAQNSKRRVKSSERIPLELARRLAEARLDLIDDTQWLCSTSREFVDAHAAFMVADHAYHAAKIKFEEASRERRADKRAGIVRHPASRIVRHSLRG